MEAARANSRSDLVVAFARALVEEEPTDLSAKAELAKALDGAGDREGALALYGDLLTHQPDSLEWVRERTPAPPRPRSPR